MTGRIRPVLSASVLAATLMCQSPASSAETTSAASRIEVSQPLPGFELESLGGERLNPESLRGEKPLVLVFFRGTW